MKPAYQEVDTPREWLEFADPDNAERFFRVDVAFMLSHYNCTYGAGCPSISSLMPDVATGCCALGVEMTDKKDWKHVEKQIKKLTPAECANLDEIKENGWFTREKKKNGKLRLPHTRIFNNRCIFANPVPEKETDPPMGCSFHVLAEHQGISHTETKPAICWQVPILTDESQLTENEEELMIIAGMTTETWGGEEPDYDNLDDALRKDYLAYWCMDTPDAFNNSEEFYKYSAVELTKIMGAPAYERLCELLEGVERKYKMAGELRNDGQPMIASLESMYTSLREKRNS